MCMQYQNILSEIQWKYFDSVKIFWYFMHMRGKTICEFTVIIWDAAFTTWPEGGPFFSCARRGASDAHSPGMAQ